jgi:hypothetical protein
MQVTRSLTPRDCDVYHYRHACDPPKIMTRFDFDALRTSSYYGYDLSFYCRSAPSFMSPKLDFTDTAIKFVNPGEIEGV